MKLIRNFEANLYMLKEDEGGFKFINQFLMQSGNKAIVRHPAPNFKGTAWW